MHTVQKSALNLGHVSTPRAKVCPESGARFYPPCKSLPRVWGTFLHPVHKCPPVFRLVFEVLGWIFMDLGLGFQTLGCSVLDLRQVILIF